ncbi:MAG: hypothetical protein KGZ43_10315 [Sulfuritalea sp.]|nr:hypothetical protein [Sulfuritalea sp.]
MTDETLVRDMATPEREFRQGLHFAFPQGVTGPCSAAVGKLSAVPPAPTFAGLTSGR